MAGTTDAATAYIDPVRYDDLVIANRAMSIDPSSMQILAREHTYIANWRAANTGRRTSEIAQPLSGLALSGGGIRSATFALGVTQAFAAQDLMRRFDYLSTVSGGGYLGASLTWLTRDANTSNAPGAFTFGMDRDRFPYPVDAPNQQTQRRADPAQDAQLIYLRQHGQYLTPGRGIDIVSGIAVVLRGLLLNLLVWLPIAALAVFVLMLIPFVARRLPFLAWLRFPDWIALIGAAASLIFAWLAVVYSLMTYRKGPDETRRYRLRRLFEKNIRYVLWIVVATVPVALMPMVSCEAQAWLSSIGVASLVTGAASAVGIFLRSRAGSDNGGVSLSIVAPIGAVLMLYGLLLLAYAWAERVYGHMNPCDPFGPFAPSGWLPGASVALLAVAVVTGHVVNVNLISVHRYYRDRLMEAFLPDPPGRGKGDSASSGLAEAANIGMLQKFAETPRPTGPYHLLNTNLILVDSKVRNWRVRGGDSFVLSPLLCGSNATGWCSTTTFLGGDLSLATAMAISGAAANPYAGGGLFRNRPVALLMSLVNLRLGYWVGHPDPRKQRSKRRTHFSTAWRELSGKLSEERPMLQLSDGGHFDNLGIYELIRRRVRLIVACDGTADPAFGFSDFITLLARIEADFGARIEFQPGTGLEVFMPSTAAGFPRNTQLAQRGFTVGKIKYSDDSEGDLIYITTTLFRGLGLAALGYKAANPAFPDQTTADQFFDDAQFEAYRQLGYNVGEAVLGDTECRRLIDQLT
jgi:hypothetical protein